MVAATRVASMAIPIARNQQRSDRRWGGAPSARRSRHLRGCLRAGPHATWDDTAQSGPRRQEASRHGYSVRCAGLSGFLGRCAKDDESATYGAWECRFRGSRPSGRICIETARDDMASPSRRLHNAVGPFRYPPTDWTHGLYRYRQHTGSKIGACT